MNKKKWIVGIFITILLIATIVVAGKWSDYSDMSSGTIADGDTFLVRDISDTTLGATGTQKEYSWANLKTDLNSVFEQQDALLDDIAALTDPNADRLLFWDDSDGNILWLTIGTGLNLTGTTLSADNTTAQWNANQLQGRNVASTAPTDGQSLVWNATNSQWEPYTVSGGSGSPGGSDTQMQYNNGGSFGGDSYFTVDDTNWTHSITQNGSNVALQIGDGTYSWDHSPQFAVEGPAEFDGTVYADNGIETGPSPEPGVVGNDEDTTNASVDWKIYGNATDTTSGSEDVDLFFQELVNGTLTTIMQLDADGYVEVANDINLANGKVYRINGSQISASNLSNGTTGSGSIVLATSPSLTTPNIGAATATTPAANDNDTSVATSAYVQTELSDYASDPLTLSNKDIILPSSVTSGTAQGEKIVLTIDSGQSVSFGSLLFISSSDGELELADASASSTLPAMFMSLGTGTGSQTVLVRGIVTNSSWSWTPGDPIFVSETAGQMTQTAPSTSGAVGQKIGVAISATTIYFDPDLTQVAVQ